MIYSSAAFIFFLMFVILLYTFLPNRMKPAWLLISSILWVCSWSMAWAAIFLEISFFNYIFLALLRNRTGKIRQYSFVALLLLNVSVFVVLKTGSFLGYRFETPYGISFFMFILFGHIVDLWRSEDKFTIEKMSHFMLMPIFFPVLVGGPVLRGKDFLPQLKTQQDISLANLIDGLMIFAYGFCKMYFISSDLSRFNAFLFEQVNLGHLSLLLLLGLVGTMQAYIDFSSYCDMGRGVAKCFGIDLLANFRAFYYSKNPNDFWQRWNISLGTWIRDYISFPLMLRFGRKINQNLILAFSFFIVGLWHGVSLNWILFGVFNGGMIVLFNMINKKTRKPAIGYLLAFIIFVGNGLLQRTDLLTQPSLWQMHLNLPELKGAMMWSAISGKLVISLLILIVLEYWQEKKKNVDWFTKKSIYLKGFAVLAFIFWIFYGLNSQMFIEDVILPPVYFRI